MNCQLCGHKILRNAVLISSKLVHPNCLIAYRKGLQEGLKMELEINPGKYNTCPDCGKKLRPLSDIHAYCDNCLTKYFYNEMRELENEH